MPSVAKQLTFQCTSVGQKPLMGAIVAHLSPKSRKSQTYVEFAAGCKWKQCLAAFTRKFGHIRPEKGRILLRKHRKVTRKSGRHVLTDRKVWPSFELEVRVP